MAFAVTSCGALEDYRVQVRTGYYSGQPCLNGEYFQGAHGFGYYDCRGRLIYRGAYNPYLYNNNLIYGPRIIINRTPVKRTRVRGSRAVVLARLRAQVEDVVEVQLDQSQQHLRRNESEVIQIKEACTVICDMRDNCDCDEVIRQINQQR